MSIHRRRLGLSIASGLIMEGLNKIAPLLILYHAQKHLGLKAFGGAQYGLAWLDVLQPLDAAGKHQLWPVDLGLIGDTIAQCHGKLSWS